MVMMMMMMHITYTHTHYTSLVCYIREMWPKLIAIQNITEFTECDYKTIQLNRKAVHQTVTPKTANIQNIAFNFRHL